MGNENISKKYGLEFLIASIKEPLQEVFTTVPEYGSISIKVVFHQGEIIRTETTKSISEKSKKWYSKGLIR